MENSIYVALSRQMALQRQLEVTSNNIANMNTTGYKNQRMLFTEFMESRPCTRRSALFKTAPWCAICRSAA